MYYNSWEYQRTSGSLVFRALMRCPLGITATPHKVYNWASITRARESMSSKKELPAYLFVKGVFHH